MEKDNWIDFSKVKEELLDRNELSNKNELSIPKTTEEIPKSPIQVRNETLDNAISQDCISTMGELQKTTEYKESIQKVVEVGVKTKLESDMLSILNEKQKNELAKYTLDCQKEQLDYRKKKEKKLIKQEVNAEILEKKIEIQKKKYGYLYKVDSEGNLIDFAPNGFINKFKAFSNWYKNLGDGIKKIIWNTLKIAMFVGIGFLVVKGFSWLANSGILENLKK